MQNSEIGKLEKELEEVIKDYKNVDSNEINKIKEMINILKIID
jgi:hypothetical protein